MGDKSRTFNSIRNISVGLVNQVILLFISFISRTIFIKILGAEYLGISGLFSNILSVLSLAELGIGNAMVYALYKPISEKDTVMIAALMQYYKKLYRIVGAFVAIVGAALIPFLPVLVRTESTVHNLTLYYILYLANSVFSYLFAYKASIIYADQKMYLSRIYSFVCYIVQFTLQIVFLLLTHYFIWYLIIQLVCTLGNNVFTAYKADKLYPYIRNSERLDLDVKRNIFSNIKAIFLYKIGGVILNNTDNILISVMMGTIWVGYYSNYSIIISALLALTCNIFASLNASVGNLNVSSDANHKHRIFDILNFTSFWIAGFASISLFILVNDFITCWIGKEYILDNLTVLAIIINFYMVTIINPVWIFRESSGLFKQTKYVIVCTATVNIVLSILLGKIMGLSGILLATAASRICTNFWYEPVLLYRICFKKNVSSYFFKQLIYLIILFITTGVTYLATIQINGTTFSGLAIKLLLCILVPNITFYILLRNSSQFKYLKKNYINRIIEKIWQNNSAIVKILKKV